MNDRHPDEESLREERRRIVRRITLWTYAFALAAVLIGLLGGALLAWILTGLGLPFLRTWLMLSIVLVLVPIMIHVGQSIREARRRDGEDAGGS